MSQSPSTSAAGSAAVAHSNQTANGQQPSTTKAPQPTVKPTFSFAAAILKGNSTPSPAPLTAAKPLVRKSAAAVGPPTPQLKDGAKGKKATAKTTTAPPAAAEKKIIPLATGSLWARKLQIVDGPLKPAPTVVVAQKSEQKVSAPVQPQPASPSPSVATTASPTLSSSSVHTTTSTASSSAHSIPPPAVVTVTQCAAVAPALVPAAATPVTTTSAVSSKPSQPTPAVVTKPATPVAPESSRIQKRGTAEANRQQQQQHQKSKTIPATTTAPKSTPAPLTVPSSTTSSAPSPSASVSTPKFGLVEVQKKHRSSTFVKREESPQPSTPTAASLLPSNYTPYPLSPYQLFLLDPLTSAVVPSVSAVNNETGLLEELSGAPSDCVPMILIPAMVGGAGELHPLCELVANQLAFYFSPDNLVKDVFLRRQMNTSTGYIQIQQLLSFPRIRALTSSAYYLECAARLCVEGLTEDQLKSSDPSLILPSPLFKIKHSALRLRQGWKRYVFPRERKAGEPEEAQEAAESSEEELDQLDDSLEEANPAEKSTEVDASTVSTSSESTPMESRADSPLAQTITVA